MKKIISVILVVALCAAMLCVPASAISDGDWEFNLKNGEAHITKYLGEGGDVVIPTKLKGATVTRICFGAFTNNKNASSIHVPSTVTVIENMAFQSCRAESIYIEDGVTKIESMAFRLNTYLKSIRIPGTVTSMGFELLSGCSGLEDVTLGEGLTYIPEEMFENCSALKSVKLPSTVTKIGPSSFYCSGLESITIPANVTVIEGYAFCGCKALSEVNFAGTKLTEIKNGAFQKCSFENIYLPVSLQKTGYYLFDGNSNLKGVVVPYGCTSIGTAILDGCSNAEWMSVPSTVKSIGADKFGNGGNLIVYCPAGSNAEKAAQNLNWNQSYLVDPSADSRIQVIFNGIRISFGSYGQNPEIINGRTMVPLRSIFEAMGAEIEWDNATKTVTATRGEQTISLTVGSNTMYVGDKTVTLDTPAMIINGRTMVPTRAIAEAFASNVQWVASARTVVISE